MDCILLFPLCACHVFLWLHAVYGAPTVMAAKSEEMCLFYQHGILLRQDRIMAH